MIFKSDSAAPDLNGFVDRGSFLEGTLRFESQFRVDGKIKGTVTSDGRLVVGEHGEVEADLDVGEVVVSGVVRGTIRARRRIHIAAGGRIFGDLFTPTLVIDDGAFFEGQCAMQKGEGGAEAASGKGVKA